MNKGLILMEDITFLSLFHYFKSDKEEYVNIFLADAQKLG